MTAALDVVGDVVGDVEVDVEVEAQAWSLALPHVEALARRAARAALTAAPDLDAARSGVVVLLADDEAVRDLNARFRAKDAATNVLSFPGPAPIPGAPPGSLGDIVLAFGVCEAEARDQGKPLADHLAHLVIHGVLHLLGHDHEDDAEAEAMEARERDLLAAMGVPDPRGPSPEPGVTVEDGAGDAPSPG
jgi:probable rRNA maturation factor